MSSFIGVNVSKKKIIDENTKSAMQWIYKIIEKSQTYSVNYLN